MGSKSFSLNKEDIKKIIIGGLIASGGAALTALCDYFQLFSDQTDFGIWEALSIVIFSMLINIIRKFVVDTQAKYINIK